MSMRNLPRKLLSFCATLALATGPVHWAAGQASEPEPPPAKKESKDVRMAKQLHVQFTMQMGVHDDYVLQDYVQRVGDRLARVSERPDLDWKFTIVDTDDVNAFATLGGYVYISRGILPYFQSEAELAAVLGHEIGHITAEHL
jgi:predicted Zn-dependent protease